MNLIQNHSQLRNAINHLFGSNRDFILAFESEGGQIDETVLPRQLSGTRGLSSAWLSAYNIFLIHYIRDMVTGRTNASSWICEFDAVSGGVFFSSDHPEAKYHQRRVGKPYDRNELQRPNSMGAAEWSHALYQPESQYRLRAEK